MKYSLSRILIFSLGVTTSLFTLIPSSLAKPWRLTETNTDKNSELRVLVIWTKDGNMLMTEPLTDIKPGETKEFKPPKQATDWKQTRFFLSGEPRESTVSGLVLKKGNSFEIGDIADVVDPFPAGTEFLIPDPFPKNPSDPSLIMFAGVDLATYIPSALSSIPSSLEIVNGVSSLLPGYLIGTTEVTFSSEFGLVTDKPFTGTVIFDSTHSIIVESVPEPNSKLGLLALGTLGAASTLKRKLKQSKEKDLEKVF